jgi:DNA-3-methyladenine glycosylase I
MHEKKRCAWSEGDELMNRYHDEEWGVAVHEDRKQFEFLVLESAQAGLSWRTVLARRENYRAAFAGFDPYAVARFGTRDVDRLLGDAGIIRNRRKIEAAINNAKRFLEVGGECGCFDEYLRRFTGGRQVINAWRKLEEIPARTKLSEAISADMKRRGFTFVGSTIIYSHLQAVGIVNDHLVDCFRYREVIEP